MSIHHPSEFLREHWQALLPEWTQPLKSVLIYLQYSPVPLRDRTLETEAVKNDLRQSFLSQAEQWHTQISAQGYLAEPFDPKHGTPIYSQAGVWSLDDVAVAHALLKFPISEQGGCHLLLHPQWQTAVFPATLLSSASPECLRALLYTPRV